MRWWTNVRILNFWRKIFWDLREGTYIIYTILSYYTGAGALVILFKISIKKELLKIIWQKNYFLYIILQCIKSGVDFL